MKSSLHHAAVVRTIVAGAVALTCAAYAAAHPFHTSVAETEWNAETKRLEVALRVTPEDLEAALTKRAEANVRLEDAEGVDELIVEYLNEHFTLRQQNDSDEEAKPLKLTWVGKEISTKAAWLYFEIDAPKGVEGLEFANRLLIDEEESQINTVVVRDGQRKTTLRFDKKHPSEVIEFDER